MRYYLFTVLSDSRFLTDKIQQEWLWWLTNIWGRIYKESYARLMTAQHLRRTYAELVNCERLTKNHKLNLRKIYAKIRKNLWPHKCCHKSIIRGNYVILLTLGHFHYSLWIANQTKSPQNKVYVTQTERFLLEYFRKRSFRCGVGPYTLHKFLLSSLFHKQKAFFRMRWSAIGQLELAVVSFIHSFIHSFICSEQLTSMT